MSLAPLTGAVVAAGDIVAGVGVAATDRVGVCADVKSNVEVTERLGVSRPTVGSGVRGSCTTAWTACSTNIDPAAHRPLLWTGRSQSCR